MGVVHFNSNMRLYRAFLGMMGISPRVLLSLVSHRKPGNFSPHSPYIIWLQDLKISSEIAVTACEHIWWHHLPQVKAAWVIVTAFRIRGFFSSAGLIFLDFFFLKVRHNKTPEDLDDLKHASICIRKARLWVFLVHLRVLSKQVVRKGIWFEPFRSLGGQRVQAGLMHDACMIELWAFTSCSRLKLRV